mmetsp:Transcript_60704/g.132838  ORF Transcript_60704/g.132838 Transcript_60704/m.132838 type:complete len:229 (-) Transcript_60704:78-764(-)
MPKRKHSMRRHRPIRKKNRRRRRRRSGSCSAFSSALPRLREGSLLLQQNLLRRVQPTRLARLHHGCHRGPTIPAKTCHHRCAAGSSCGLGESVQPPMPHVQRYSRGNWHRSLKSLRKLGDLEIDAPPSSYAGLLHEGLQAVSEAPSRRHLQCHRCLGPDLGLHHAQYSEPPGLSGQPCWGKLPARSQRPRAAGLSKTLPKGEGLRSKQGRGLHAVKSSRRPSRSSSRC